MDAFLIDYRACVLGVVLPIKSVGVQGDRRTFAHPLLIIGDADWDTLEEISTRVTNTFSQINRVVYQLATQQSWSMPFLSKATLTRNRIQQLQALDRSVTQFLSENNLYSRVWQCPVILIPCASVPDTESVVLRPVDSLEAMTASFSRLDQSLLKKLAIELLSPTVSSVLYDVTNKPPGTIEWE